MLDKFGKIFKGMPVPDAANDTDTAGIRDSSCEPRTGSNIHACKHDRVIDLEEVGHLCLEYLWSR